MRVLPACAAYLPAPLRPPYVYIVAGVLLALLLAVFIALKIRRRRHDKALARAVAQELAPPTPQPLDAPVSVIPREALPSDDNTVFMPVPAEISRLTDFVSEAKDGVTVRSCARAEDVDYLMEDGEAMDTLVPYTVEEYPEREIEATVYLDDLSERFSTHGYVNLSILKKHRMVPKATTYLKVEARGILRKPLMVLAHEFTPAAVKMLSLTGGRALLAVPCEEA